MIRWLGVVGVLASAGALFFACGDSESATVCDPGTEVFCKCRGGFEGTKTCNADGATFGECTTPDGECPEIGGEGGSSSSVTPICLAGETVTCSCDNGDEGSKDCAEDGLSFGDCTVDGAPCGSGSGDKLIYTACADGGECVTGTCLSGYCSRTCEIFTDCYDDENMLYGDCVTIGGANQCAPYCLTQGDCGDFGAESACGGAVALDSPDISFGVCAYWGADLQGMPYGTLCDSNTGELLFADQIVIGECSLGAPGVQNYCFDDECTKLCYEDIDCPEMNCTSNGSVAGCCETEPECN